MKNNVTEKLQKLLRDFDTATLITRGRADSLHVRPMTIAGVDDNCDLWFITDRSTAKVYDIENNPQVQVVCQNSWSSCVSVSGHAVLDYDRIRLQTLWNASYQIWFPEGLNDPEIVLIHVVGERAEYWDNTGKNALTYAYQAIKAMVTGTTPEIIEGDQHGTMKLTGR